MSDHLTWSELDRDGAIEEAAAKVADTRGSFLRKAAIGGGAVVAGGAFAGALPALAKGASGAIPQSDIDILNFALTLEFLEAAFYADAKTKGRFTGETGVFARVVGNHEFSHVKFLQKVLGAKAVKRPRFDFKDTTTNRLKFLQTAKALEDTGVHAYLGQVGNIKNKTVLAGAGRILPVEARHAAWIRAIIGQQGAGLPAPAGFEDGFTKAKVLSIVSSTGFIVS